MLYVNKPHWRPGRKEYALHTDIYFRRDTWFLYFRWKSLNMHYEWQNIKEYNKYPPQFSMSVQPMNPHYCDELNIKVAGWCLTVTLEFICMFLKIMLFNIYEAFVLSVLLFWCRSCYAGLLSHVPCQNVVPTVNETIWPRSPRYLDKFRRPGSGRCHDSWGSLGARAYRALG